MCIQVSVSVLVTFQLQVILLQKLLQAKQAL